MKITPKIKRKKYLVPVESQTRARMIVFANSKGEAYKIANKDMQESFDRKLEEYFRNPNPMIKDMTGAGWALKTGIEIIE